MKIDVQGIWDAARTELCIAGFNVAAAMANGGMLISQWTQKPSIWTVVSGGCFVATAAVAFGYGYQAYREYRLSKYTL